ncbi:hypothetical protein O3M35_009322 [Rhynocoris fuscipes]|uniref:Uncharacterized protein n=1 Tax=Rhynocoris fuscipes TaxID=488301 RepID=A0AAW1D622_9HEMI
MTDETESNDYSEDDSALHTFEIVEVGPKAESNNVELTKETSVDTTKDTLKDFKGHRIKKIPLSHCVDVGIILKKCKELYDKWNDDNKDKDIKTWKFCTGDAIFSSHGPYLDDILLFCLIYTYRGTSFHNIKRISTGELKEIIEHLGIKYEIAKPKRNEWYSPESLTLERIVRAYPDICCDLYSKGKFKSILPDNVIAEELIGNQRAVLCPLFPSVTCSILLQKNTNILPQLLWLAYKYDEKITKNLFDLKALWRYLVQSLLVNLIPEDIKRNLCKKWELITVYDTPAEIFSKTRFICMNNLEDVFGNHKDWPKVKKHLNNYSKDKLTSNYCDKYGCLRDDLIINDEEKLKIEQRIEMEKKTENENQQLIQEENN